MASSWCARTSCIARLYCSPARHSTHLAVHHYATFESAVEEDRFVGGEPASDAGAPVEDLRQRATRLGRPGPGAVAILLNGSAVVEPAVPTTSSAWWPASATGSQIGPCRRDRADTPTPPSPRPRSPARRGCSATRLSRSASTSSTSLSSPSSIRSGDFPTVVECRHDRTNAPRNRSQLPAASVIALSATLVLAFGEFLSRLDSSRPCRSRAPACHRRGHPVAPDRHAGRVGRQRTLTCDLRVVRGARHRLARVEDLRVHGTSSPVTRCRSAPCGAPFLPQCSSCGSRPVADDLVSSPALLGALGTRAHGAHLDRRVGSHDGQWVVVAAFGAASIVFLALQHHLNSRPSPHVDRPGERDPCTSDPRLRRMLGRLPAVAVGVAVAPALPGGDKPLFETSGLGSDHASDSYRTSVPPLLDIGAKLNRGEQQLDVDRPRVGADDRRIALDDYRSVR